MRLNEGVEWAVHVCAVLAALPPGSGLSAAALAAYHDLPPSYMAKQLQALSKAGIVTSQRGVRGGYRLARRPREISLWDITTAIEGAGPSFRCREIRRRGPCRSPPKSCRRACPIAAAFLAAEDAYRKLLSEKTVADMVIEAAPALDAAWRKRFQAWLSEAATRSEASRR